jgi:histone H3/H4
MIQVNSSRRGSNMIRLAPVNYKPNFKRLAEVRRLQKSETCHTSKAAIERVTREIMATLKHGMRIKPAAIEAIQVASEDYLHELFQQADILAAHAGRKTIQKRDLNMVKKLGKIREG